MTRWLETAFLLSYGIVDISVCLNKCTEPIPICRIGSYPVEGDVGCGANCKAIYTVMLQSDGNTYCVVSRTIGIDGREVAVTGPVDEAREENVDVTAEGEIVVAMIRSYNSVFAMQPAPKAVSTGSALTSHETELHESSPRDSRPL